MHISMLTRNMKQVEKAGRWNKNGVKRFSSSHHFLESLARLLSVKHLARTRMATYSLDHIEPFDFEDDWHSYMEKSSSFLWRTKLSMKNKWWLPSLPSWGQSVATC